jgi:hypothetical protein
MSWDGIFGLTNSIALIAWLLVIAGPRGQKTLALVLYLGVGMLCFAYAAMIVGMHGGAIDANRLPGTPPPNFLDYNIAGLRNLFMSDGGLVMGWTHYLAFDLFVGQWIAKDADNKGFHRLIQAPVLLLTLLAGPVGLLVWLALRDRRARKVARG